MIVKQTPEDFHVEECTDVPKDADGPFALYRLEKRGWTTPDALAVVRQRWKLEARRVSCGGLKDRHAHTIQHFSILRGPRRKLNQQGVEVTYLGQLPYAFTSEQIVGNRFHLVLRGLGKEEADSALKQLADIRSFGVPNYFDDQRFGSVAGGGAFFAKAVVLGRLEQALKLALSAPYPHDRAAQKREKQILRSQWGKWRILMGKLPRGQARTVVEHLADQPDDFAGAIARLKPELRGLYLSAYQSHLWNQMLAHWLRTQHPAHDLTTLDLLLGPVPIYRNLDAAQLAEFRDLSLPLPSPRTLLEESDPRRAIMERVLADEGLTLEQLKLKEVKDMFFSRGDRPALCLPTDLTGQSAADDTHPGMRKLLLTFSLPRGSYATILVKRLGMARQ